MSYLLDSSICIALLRDRSSSIKEAFREAIARRDPIWISSVVLHELWYGVHKSSRPVENAEALRGFLRGPVALLRFDGEDARVAGEIRAELERTGKTIGSYDTLIAGQCLRNDLIVVTSNLSEFRRVKGLHCKDWSK
ncbi:MAG: type II toxin-antitoxin system VapC family toxin [Candidatus Korobacteraceae bacterium]